jgi:hypothetical protein
MSNVSPPEEVVNLLSLLNNDGKELLEMSVPFKKQNVLGELLAQAIHSKTDALLVAEGVAVKIERSFYKINKIVEHINDAWKNIAILSVEDRQRNYRFVLKLLT